MFAGLLKREIVPVLARFLAVVTMVIPIFLITVQTRGAQRESNLRFDEGNRLYEQRKYSEAIAAYQSALTNGAASAELLFNLANACFKNGEVGRAILNYRKAAQLAPRDPDTQANLRFARDSISGSTSVPETMLDRAAELFTLNELTVGATLLFWIWLALLIARQFRPVIRPQVRTITTIAGALFLLGTAWLLTAWVHSRQETAIVVAREAIVPLGPLDESQTAFTAPDGTEMRLLDRRDKWIEVSDRQNRVGWVKQGSLIIFPGRPKS